MTGSDIAIVVEQTVTLAIKLLELAKAASKGNLEAAETLKMVTAQEGDWGKVHDRLHAFLADQYKLDKKFDGGE